MNQIELTSATLFKPLFPFVINVKISTPVFYEYNEDGSRSCAFTAVKPMLVVKCEVPPSISFDVPQTRQFLIKGFATSVETVC